MSGENQPGLTARPCEYCGEPIPDRRKDARYCSTSHRVMASRRRKRQAEIHGGLVARGGQEFTDQSRPDHWGDPETEFDDDQDDEHQDDRPQKWIEDDERFAATIAGDDPAVRNRSPRRAPIDSWRRWRGYGNRHGTEHPEQTADRIARQRAAYDASMSRIDSYTAGRVQDRHDPRTAANPGRNGAASRRLNQRYAEQPPSWAASAFDFTNETIDGGPFTRGRPFGRRSRHADYRWAGLDDGFRF